jgi:glycosyltransferase involved in cell wall biosynthesis
MSINEALQRANKIKKDHGWAFLKNKIINKLLIRKSWSSYNLDARSFAHIMDFSSEDIRASRMLHKIHQGEIDIDSITWFLPEFEHAYYGGIQTLLRFADYLKGTKGVENRFVILGNMDADKIGGKISNAFPGLSGQPVIQFNHYEQVDKFPATDAAIASLWGTAYFLLRFNQTKRKFYFIQDYEPLFYPAGSISAQVDSTYLFGYYGITNTPTLKEIYESQYAGQAEYFLPCVDTNVFYPAVDQDRLSDNPRTLFFYGRPSVPRNGFELGAQAIRILKMRLGSQVRIVAAGENWKPKDYDLDGVIENLGLLDYYQTAGLYRACKAGLVMMFTRHPSYLPFELMASGSLVISNKNPATSWFLKDGENCRLSDVSATCLARVLEESLLDTDANKRITSSALNQIKDEFYDWGQQFDKIFRFMRNPSIA